MTGLRPGWLLLCREEGGGVKMQLVQDEPDHAGAQSWTPTPAPPSLAAPTTLRDELNARKVSAIAEIVSQHALEYVNATYGASADIEIDEPELRSRIAEYVADTSRGCGWHASE